MDTGKLEQAIEYALAHETAWARSPDETPWGVHQTDPAPWNRLFGPVHARGGVCGVVMQNGKEITRFGDADRADLTFSVPRRTSRCWPGWRTSKACCQMSMSQ
jgi:hypothetical protein